MDLSELKELDPRDFEGEELSQKEILEWFKICDAIWLHDGNPEKPHAELTSGMCSNGYVNCNKVLQYTNLCEILAGQLILKLEKAGIKTNNIDWVASSAYAAITFGHEVARQIGCCFGFTEKDLENPKKMVLKRFEIPEGSTVLQVEELITTLGTTEKVGKSIVDFFIDAGKGWLPRYINFVKNDGKEKAIVATIIHRPAKLPVNNWQYEVIPLVELEIWTLPPEECPLCKAGSKPLRPKMHWKELTGSR